MQCKQADQEEAEQLDKAPDVFNNLLADLRLKGNEAKQGKTASILVRRIKILRGLGMGQG